MTAIPSAGDQLNRLVDIMRRLRSSDGCPWDQAQTFATLRPFVLEETYEVLDALDRGDLGMLRGELGDFVFEAVFLAQMADEAGAFSLADSLTDAIDKLVRRHPHVFGRKNDGSDPATPAAVEQKWEEIKDAERAGAGGERSALAGVPRTLPALLRAYEIGARAASVGFDWAKPGDVVDKIEEEVEELRQAASGDPAHLEEELGDALFALANLARKLGIEPESALRRANDKFTGRFEALEASFRAQGRALSAATLDEMEAEWQRLKME